MDVYANAQVQAALHREYHYIFASKTYPGIPKINLETIKSEPFEINNNTLLTPIEVLHYKLPVLGFRIGDFTYITDAKTISTEERKKIKGTKILIINALRRKPHLSHFNLDEALAFIKEIGPEKAYLTHISHLFDTHENISKELPEGVFAAYDGLQIFYEKNGRPADIDGFSAEQRFYMSWGTIWRTIMRDEAMKNLIKTDPHSPGMYRAYMPLQNVDAFYTAFDIQEGDKMYLPKEQRVRIW